jgi:hypothetical protein
MRTIERKTRISRLVNESDEGQALNLVLMLRDSYQIWTNFLVFRLGGHAPAAKNYREIMRRRF